MILQFGDGTLVTTEDRERWDVGGYELPIASGSVLGGVKIGSGLTILGDGTLQADGGALDIATSTTLGGIKSSASVFVAPDTGVATVPTATTSAAGLLSSADKWRIDSAVQSSLFGELGETQSGALTTTISGQGLMLNNPYNILFLSSNISGNIEIPNPTNGIEGQTITWHAVASGSGAITFGNLFRPQFGVSTISYTSGQRYILTAIFIDNGWNINWSTY